MELPEIIEAILFFKGEPLTIKFLSNFLGISESEIKAGSETLKKTLNTRGIVLVATDQEISLGTHPELNTYIEKLAKEEISGPLTKAALETLSIVLYRSPITKSEIDYIRGVNSHFILRSLLIRGLIQKSTNPKDARKFLYAPTMDLLSHLGIGKAEDLPEYKDYNATINKSVQVESENYEEF